MKVLFLCKSFPVFGGVERWLTDMVVGLRMRGVDAQVALAKGRRFHDPHLFAKLHPGLSPHYTLDGTTGCRSERVESVRKIIRAVKPDIVVPVLMADALIGAILEKQSRSFSLIYPIHEIGAGPGLDLRRFQGSIDAVVSVNQEALEQVKQHLNDRHLAKTIPCGVSIPSNSAESQQLVHGCGDILWCGRLEFGQKRPQDLLPIMSELVRMSLANRILVAGDGDYRATLESQIAAAGLKDRFVLLGRVDHEHVLDEVMPTAHMLLITSERETGPLVAFEAMARGVPVVTADFGGRVAGGVLQDSETCLVYPTGDLSAAAHCIHRLVVDPELHARIGAAGRALVEANRSVDLMVDRWCEVFEETVNRRSNRCAHAVRNSRNIARGRILGLRIPGTLSAGIRRVFDRPITHTYASDEWPFYYLDLT